MNLTVIGIVAGLIALLIIAGVGFLIMRSWIKVARADEALVVSGRKQSSGDSNVAVIVNGKAIVNPVTQRSEIISLRSRQISLTTEAQSGDNITLRVEASALVKIGSHPDYVRQAAERFASQDDAVEVFTTEQLEGALRGVVAKLKVSELMRERKKFSDQILEDISTELEKQGLILDSFQIRGITDDNGYIQSLGVPQIQEKRQEAEISEANANREITKRNIATKEENLVEQTAYDQNIQESNAKVGKATATAEQAEHLTRAQAEQEVLQQNAMNKQAQLDADVRKVADADRYRREQEAQATKFEQVEAARAQKEIATEDAEALKVKAAQRAQSARVEAEAQAASNKAVAEAEAEAIRMKGKAKAEAIEAEARALEQNREVMLAQKALEVLPSVMEQFAKGYANVGSISIVGGGSDEANVSNRIAGENAMAMKSSFDTIKNSTGIDLRDILQSNASGRGMGEGLNNSRNNVVNHEDSVNENLQNDSSKKGDFNPFKDGFDSLNKEESSSFDEDFNSDD